MEIKKLLDFLLLSIAYSQCFIHFQDITNKVTLFENVNVAILCTILLFIVAIGQNSPALPKTVTSMLEELGRATYSFYLLHQTVGMFVAVVILQNVTLNYSHIAILTFISIGFASIGIERMNIVIWKRIESTKNSAEPDVEGDVFSNVDSQNFHEETEFNGQG